MVDLAHARDFLATRFGGEAGAVAPLGAGAWSQAYGFQRAGRDYIFRFGLHGDDFARDRLAEAFAGPALPIPAVVELGQAFEGCYAIAGRHYAAIGLAVPGFEQRLLGCQLHIGLAGMAYQAYAGDRTNLEGTARRTLDLARGYSPTSSSC